MAPKWWHAAVLPALLIPGLAWSQSASGDKSDPSTWSPPPLVEAQASDAPRANTGPATPPPPGYAQPPPSTTTTGAPSLLQPNSYQGSSNPYGAYPMPGVPGMEVPRPPPEYGLMASEALFGMLTSAGTALIPYFLLLKPLSVGSGADAGLVNLIFILTFSAVPLAVSQTEVSLANGSRYYTSEGWAAALSGLLMQAAVIGGYYLLRPNLPDGGEFILLAGTVALVPLAEMIAINFAKIPRYKFTDTVGGLVNYSSQGGLNAGVPLPYPILTRGPGGSLGGGLGISVLKGRF